MTSELDEIAAKLEDEKAITQTTLPVRKTPLLRPLTSTPPPKASIPHMAPPAPVEHNLKDLSYRRHDGQMEHVNTLAEHFVRRESKPPPTLPTNETTVILTHRSKAPSSKSSKSTKASEKLSQYQQAWGVSSDTAKLMLKRERIMKGLIMFDNININLFFIQVANQKRKPVNKSKAHNPRSTSIVRALNAIKHGSQHQHIPSTVSVKREVAITVV